MGAEIIEYGQIKYLRLPDGWKEELIPKPSVHTYSLREFHYMQSPDATFCIYSPAYPHSSVTGQAFVDILDREPHILNADEISNIAYILDEAAFPDLFRLFVVRTDYLGERKVLIVEGRWLAQGWDTYSIYVKADDAGRVIQQIYFLAPTPPFAEHVESIRKSLARIVWIESG